MATPESVTTKPSDDSGNPAGDENSERVKTLLENGLEGVDAGPDASVTPPKSLIESPYALPKKKVTIRLTLRDAIQLALEKNLDIRMLRIDRRSTGRDITVEKSAFDPFVFFGGNFGKNRRPTASFLDIGSGGLDALVQVNPSESTSIFAGIRGTTPIGTSYTLQVTDSAFNRPVSTLFGFNPQVSANASLTFTQPLLKGAWYPFNTAGIRIARNTRLLNRENFELTVANTISSIEQAYWNLSFAIKDYQARGNALDLGVTDFENSKKKLDAGSIAPIDVTVIKSQVALRRIEFSDAALSLEASRDTLLDLINHSGKKTLRDRWESGQRMSPYDDILVIPTDAVADEELVTDRDTAVQTAFSHRPDYRQIGYQLRNQRVQVDLAEHELWPDLSLTGSWQWDGLADDYDESFSSLTGGEFYSWSLGLRLEVPLSFRGPRQRLAKTKDALLRLSLQRAKTENLIVLEIDEILRRLDQLKQKWKELEEVASLREKLLDAEKKKLKVGKSIPYLVSTIENDLIASQNSALRAQLDYQLAISEYYRVTGTLLERHAVILEDGYDEGFGRGD